MLGEEFGIFIKAMKNIDPHLSEEKIKPALMDIELKYSDYSIDKWVTDILHDFFMFESVAEEIKFLYGEFKKSEVSFHEHRVNTIYANILEGKVSKTTEVFAKKVVPYYDTEIEVLWNLNKAKNVIKLDRLKKVDFPFNKIDISFGELNVSYLGKAAKNPEPGILLQYEPLKDSEYEYFLLDGNHRITGKYLNKCRKKFRGVNIDFTSPTYIKNSNLKFPVFHLQSEESLKSMEHPFFQYFYLIHMLYTQMVAFTKNQNLKLDDMIAEVNNIVDNQNSRYNILRNIVI